MWSWLLEDVVLAVHQAQIGEHGGTLGIRDRGLLASALARPQQAAAYARPPVDAIDLAAMYGIGIIRNHPFLDGNKRVGLVLVGLFLELHGFELDADDAEKVLAIRALAAGDSDETTVVAGVRSRATVAKR